jgi:hypothetical protein
MKLPRDVSGSNLAQALHKLGYSISAKPAVIFASLRINEAA